MTSTLQLLFLLLSLVLSSIIIIPIMLSSIGLWKLGAAFSAPFLTSPCCSLFSCSCPDALSSFGDAAAVLLCLQPHRALLLALLELMLLQRDWVIKVPRLGVQQRAIFFFLSIHYILTCPTDLLSLFFSVLY